MKYLILLEGSSEKVFVELLMEQGLLKIEKDDMIDLKPHNKKQLDNYLCALIRQLDYDEKVTLIRIGDTLGEKVKILDDIKHHFIAEEKYCTKPEFEMLIIIHEGLYSEYNKRKNHRSPKEFAKQNIKYNEVRYHNNQKWLRAYFASVDLHQMLVEYKRVHRHNKYERYLCDLLKSPTLTDTSRRGLG